jgi:VWFA-related protein
MNRRRHSLTFILMIFAVCWLGVRPVEALAAPAGAQQPSAQAPPTAPGIIKAQTNLVLVDAVVTDKKGAYIRDLEAKDFKVFEDNKERTINSFSKGTEANGPSGPAQRHYMVLFFDNSTMDIGDQMQSRQAAAKFIDRTAASDHLMAIVNFGGTLQITQNFTANVDRLKAVVSNSKLSAVNPNDDSTTQLASLGIPTLGGSAMASFGARNMLLALRDLAKRLQSVPGRKTLILFSSGFPIMQDPELVSELSATIDACNKANVAIYPIDARGLFAPLPVPGAGLLGPMFPHQPGELAFLLFQIGRAHV